MAISFDKVKEQAPELINLAKLSRVELSKKDLSEVKARVALVLDYSGSMHGQYASGAMQRLAEKVLAIATGFDDDGDIDFFLFDTEADHVGQISLSDYKGSVDRLRGKRHMGTTAYDKAFTAVADHYGLNPGGSSNGGGGGLFGFGKKKQPESPAGITSADVPVYAIFLTDGAPNSKPAAVKALTDVSRAPIFWKFLSVGRENMEFLQKLDDLNDRFIDNADYQHLGNDIDAIDDKKLFDLLLVEFREWLVEAKQKGLLTS